MNLDVSIYPLFFGIGCGVGLSYYLLSSKDHLKEKLIYSIGTLALSLICAKAFFIISLPSYAYAIFHYMSFINGGGYVFYGGLLGGMLSTYLFKKYSNNFYSNGLIPAICLGHCIGRIGCYLTGCCFGIKLGDWVVPVQLVESASLLMLFFYFHKKKQKFLDEVHSYLFLYAALRFFLEFFRGDIHRGIYLSFSTSQWISVAIILFMSIISKKTFLNFKKS